MTVDQQFHNHKKCRCPYIDERKMFSSIVRNVVNFAKTQIGPANHGILAVAQIHTSRSLNFKSGPSKWPQYNKKIFPPQAPDDPVRPAVI